MDDQLPASPGHSSRNRRPPGPEAATAAALDHFAHRGGSPLNMARPGGSPTPDPDEDKRPVRPLEADDLEGWQMQVPQGPRGWIILGLVLASWLLVALVIWGIWAWMSI